MLTKKTIGSLVWIDVLRPEEEEIRSLAKEYDIHPLVAEELLHPSIRPKVELGNEHLIYLILHFPDIHGKDGEQEIDFVIGKNFLITAHYGAFDILDDCARVIETNAKIPGMSAGSHAGFLFFYIMRSIYQAIDMSIENTYDDIKMIESNLFHGDETQLVRSISEQHKKVLDMDQMLRYHETILKSFEKASQLFFGPEFGYYTNALLGEYYKIKSVIDHQRESLRDLRETNNSLLSAKFNDIIKNLTVMTFIMLPLALITGIFSMNVASNLIFISNQKDFIILLCVMGTIALSMIMFFKHKKWF